jgi:hypothetical protein
MIRTMLAAAALSTMVLVPQANAWNDLLESVWGTKGNDTGGIIPWTPENEANAYQIASERCSSWNKYAVATSLHRQYGDYIGYRCVWDKPGVLVVRERHRVDVKIEK